MFTRDHVYQLQHGHSFSLTGDAFTANHLPLYKHGPGYFEAAGAWAILGPQIVAEWVTLPPRYGSDHCGPGTRPFGWWLFDAPERRRRVDGGVHPFDDPARQAHVARIEAEHPPMRGKLTRLYFGKPAALCKGEGFSDFDVEFEQEFEFIARLDLWLPGELELGVPLLADAIASMRADFNSREKEPDDAELDRLRRYDALLVCLRAKLEGQP